MTLGTRVKDGVDHADGEYGGLNIETTTDSDVESDPAEAYRGGMKWRQSARAAAERERVE